MRTPRRSTGLSLRILAALLLCISPQLACDGNGAEEEDDGPDLPVDLTVTATPDALTLATGETGQVTFEITRTGFYAGFEAALSVAVGHAAISVTFVPDVLAPNENVATAFITNDGLSTATEIELAALIDPVEVDPNEDPFTNAYGQAPVAITPGTPAPVSGWNIVQSITGNLHDLDCPSPSVCYAVGGYTNDPVAYKTTDGGATWSAVTIPASGEVHAIQFLDASTGYIGGYSETDGAGFLLRTTNGGTTWTDVSLGWPANLPVRAVHFLAANDGYAAGGIVQDSTKILFTSDGGSTWTYHDWLSATHQIERIYFWSVSNGYASVNHNTGTAAVYHTTDGGNTWALSSGGTQFRDVSGGLGAPGFGALYSSSNPGSSWSSETVPDPDGGTTLNIQSVATINGTTWIAGSNNGPFVAYKQAGSWVTDWNPGPTPTNEGLMQIEMFSATEGVAVGRAFMALRVP